MMALTTYTTALVVTALWCLAERTGPSAGFMGPSAMLPALACVSLFHAIFITPVFLQLTASVRGKTSNKRLARAFRIAGTGLIWQVGLLAPFAVLAVCVVPTHRDVFHYAVGLVAMHGWGATMAVLILGRMYPFFALLFTCAAPLAAFLVADMGGTVPYWLAMFSPFGQMAALTGFFEGLPENPASGLGAAVLNFGLIYMCLAVLPQIEQSAGPKS